MPTPRNSTRRALLSERPRLVRDLAILAYSRLAWCPRKGTGCQRLAKGVLNEIHLEESYRSISKLCSFSISCQTRLPQHKKDHDESHHFGCPTCVSGSVNRKVASAICYVVTDRIAAIGAIICRNRCPKFCRVSRLSIWLLTGLIGVSN